MSQKSFQIIPALTILLASRLFVGQSFGQESPGVYIFQGCEVSAKSGKAYFPILRVDRRKILVDTGTHVLKVSQRAPCRPKPAIVLTDRLVEVLELNYGTSSIANMRREADAVAVMQFEAFQAETRIADRDSGVTGVVSGLYPGDLQNSASDIKRESDDDQRDTRQDIVDGVYGLDGVADTVSVNGEILSKVDIPDAFGILVVTFNQLDSITGSVLGKRRIARAKYIGSLNRDEIFKLKTRFSLSEFNLRDADLSLHLYASSGEEIALSSSRGLKELSVEEYGKLKLALDKIEN